MIDVSQIANRLRAVREAKNMSKSYLSQLSGVSQTHIRDIERGERNPSLNTLISLAKPLGLSLADLVRENERSFDLNEKERVLVECFRMMPDESGEALLALMTSITKNELRKG